MPNKIIYIERDQMTKLTALYPEREGKDLRELLIMVFKTFGVHSVARPSITCGPTTWSTSSKADDPGGGRADPAHTPAFEKFDKKKGVFFYREAPVVVEPVIEEAPAVVERPAVILTPRKWPWPRAAEETAETDRRGRSRRSGRRPRGPGQRPSWPPCPRQKAPREEKKPAAPPSFLPKRKREEKDQDRHRPAAQDAPRASAGPGRGIQSRSSPRRRPSTP